MDDEHRYIPTPTHDHRIIASTRPAGLRYHTQPFGERGLRDSTPSHVNRGRKKFVNTRSFSTLTTKLSTCFDQPNNDTEGVSQGQDRNVPSGGVNLSHSQIDNDGRTGSVGEHDSSQTLLDSCDIPVNNTTSRTLSRTVDQNTLASNALASENQFGVNPLYFHVAHPQIGILREDGPAFEKTDSIGFQVSNPTFVHRGAPDRYSEDHPQTYTTTLDTPTSEDIGLHCHSDPLEMTVANNVSLEEESQCPVATSIISENDQPECPSSHAEHDASSMQGQVASSAHLPHECNLASAESVDMEPVMVESPCSTSPSATSPDDFVFQVPLPMSSPTKTAPSLRRQLSKRKSTTFIPFLPDTLKENEDEEEEDNDSDDEFHSLGGSCGRRSDPCTPTSPKTRRLENYDPYRIFDVQHTPCLILTVRVLRGRNITMGYQDFYDTPDPYVNLVMRSSPEGRKSTTVKDDDPNPVWNESFTFYINFTQANVLEISLMESNYIFDQKVGTVWFDIVNINEMDKPQLETFVFNDVSQVDIEFKLEFDRNPTLRYSLCLSDAEKTFMERRKEKILEGLRKLLGEEEAPMNTDEVPTIAVIGSGGGFRAMTGYSGVIKALVDTGVFDCSMYACGLSGSSWLVSTLYSHPKWPNLDMSEFLDELKHSVDKSLLRFFNVSTMYNYAKFMVEKRREGQPVSFTDIFGRMVGETLLQGRMQTTLSDQREKIKDGAIPMPLYTCVHVKKDVPARSFQEWVEFSPYEIGLPKYGTFMDSELFGSKFFMGKLVKKFKEQPLHFLQGIWGSAFCILFKRLLEDNRRIDPVEMVRQEMGKQLDEAAQESSSDCSDNEVDDDDDEESSTESSMDSDTGSVRGLSSVEHDVSKDEDDMGSGSEKGKKTQQRETRAVNDTKNSSDGEVEMIMGRERSMSAQIDDENVDGDSAYEGEEGEDYDVDLDDDEDDNDLYQSAIQSPRGIMKKKGSLEKLRARKNQRSSKDSASPDNDIVQDQIEVPQFQSSSRLAAADLDKSSDLKKSVNWGACPTRGNKPNLTETQQRRQAYLRAGSSMRKSRTGSKSYWKKLMKGIFESNSWELLSTRRGRAAVIHNFMRGLSLERSYPLSPFTPIDERVKEGDEFDGIFEMHPTSVKHIYMVDAGLTFNSPYPLILRPQRGVDIILSFDFSARPSDSHQPFKELLLAEKWARLNRLPFPPIDTSVFDREGMKELYIFRHPTNPHCPIVLHFVLINKTFKYYKKPGIPRETKEEFDFAEFDVFDDPKAPYSTFNFTYEHRNFERLSQLMEFNTLLHIDDIKQVIKDVIKQRREGPPKVPIQSKDIKLLRMKSVQEMRKLRKYISRMESRSSLYSTNSPSTPFHTPAHTIESSTNPFFAGYHRELSLSLSSSSDSSIFGTPREKQSESVSRGSRSKKHIHPSQIFSESEEVRWQTTAPCDITENSSISPTCSSVESVFGTPPNSMHHFQNFEQIFPSDKPSSDVCLEPIDVCDGPVKETGVTNQSSAENNRERTNTLSMESAEHCDSALDSQTDGGLAETRPSLSPKVKIPDPSVTSVNSSDSSGFGSLGAVCGTDSSGTSSAGFSSTPGTGTSGKSSSGFSSHGSTGSLNQFMTKGKTRKESPPNPFFAKAFFMRSPNNSTSSTSSSSSLQSYAGSDIGNGKRVNPLRGNSYRLSPQTPSTLSSPETASGSSVPSRLNSHSQVLSPLAFTSGTKSSYSSQPQKGTSPETPDEYCLAPAAFRKDGTPVFDTVQAKMFYESVKDKRKIFRRQSTISSLNSISLDESGPSYDDQAEDDNSNSDKGLCSPVIPHKKPFIYSDTHFRDHFYSCVEDLGEDENTNKEQLITETAGMGNIPQNKPLATDYGVDFDIEDLSQFRGVDDTSLRQMDHWESSEPSESVDSNHEVIESQESDAQCVQSPI